MVLEFLCIWAVGDFVVSKNSQSIFASPLKLIFGLFIWGMIAAMGFLFFGANYLSYQIDQERSSRHHTVQSEKEELSEAEKSRLRQDSSSRATTDKWSNSGGASNGWGNGGSR